VLCLLAMLPIAAFAGGDQADELLATALSGVDGRAHSIDDWRGKIRVVNFWATWCGPCRSEIPLLSAARKEWRGKGVEVIGVAIDGRDDVRAFVDQARINYPVLVAEQQGQTLMQSGGNTMGTLPFTLLLDQRGNIIRRHAGVLDARLLKTWLSDAAVAHAVSVVTGFAATADQPH